MRGAIIVIGAFPPPINGYSTMMKLFFLEIARRGLRPIPINRAPVFILGRRIIVLDAVVWALGYPMSLFHILRNPSAGIYIGLSSRGGLLFDAVHAFLATVFQRALYLHHHNYNYIVRKSPLMVCLLKLAPRARHIFLCERMRSDFLSQYGDLVSKSYVQSNLALAGAGAGEAHLDQIRGSGVGNSNLLVVSYLSNISREKGIDLFLSIAEAAADLSSSIRFRIAGPLPQSIRPDFIDKVESLGSSVEYVGPVYGRAKEIFLAQADALIFPSLYENEAESLVILEALSMGIVVIATERGCLSRESSDSSDRAIFVGPPLSSDFKQYALDIVLRLARDQRFLSERQAASVASFKAKRDLAAKSLDNLFVDILQEC